MTADGTLAPFLEASLVSLDVPLEPLGAPTFQVTTFANTGPSFYTDAQGRLSAVVDSVASMANQLEATVFDEQAGTPVEAIAALPWVEAVDPNGERYTTSRTAAHRLNAHALINGTVEARTFGKLLEERLGRPAPPINPHLGRVLWEFDPLTLVHGTWIPGIWDGRARVTRALSARIDAHDVQTQSVQVGGQKSADHLVEVGVSQRGAEGETVEGEVPVTMSEVSASSIVGRILLDVRLVRGYRLGEAATRAVVSVALLEIAELLAGWPRRRSRCALAVAGEPRVRPNGLSIPDVERAREVARGACGAATGTPRATPLRVSYKPKARKAKEQTGA